MKHATTGSTARIDFALEDAPATALAFDRDDTQFLPDFCVVTIALDATGGPQVVKVDLSGPRILRNGKPGRATEYAFWEYSDEVGGMFPDPPQHVLELADAALDHVRQAALVGVRETLPIEASSAVAVEAKRQERISSARKKAATTELPSWAKVGAPVVLRTSRYPQRDGVITSISKTGQVTVSSGERFRRTRQSGGEIYFEKYDKSSRQFTYLYRAEAWR